MASVDKQRGSTPSVFLSLGVLLSVINIAGIGLAIYCPVWLRQAPKDVLFDIGTGVGQARMLCIVMGCFVLLCVVQIWQIPRLITRMVDDSTESVRAEKAMRWAYRLAYITAFLCVASLVIATRTFRNWAEIHRLQG
jgi:hypothetical protein